MRIYGCFAVLRCRAGLSVGPENLGATPQCFCYRLCSVSSSSVLFIRSHLIYLSNSLEAAAANPEALSQAAIIDNLDPVEAARLDKVRNIGIAVYTTPIILRSPST